MGTLFERGSLKVKMFQCHGQVEHIQKAALSIKTIIPLSTGQIALISGYRGYVTKLYFTRSARTIAGE